MISMQVHYLGNEGRGTVWEEIIINCPAHIQLLSMSATVANPDDLGFWITKVGCTFYMLTQQHAAVIITMINSHIYGFWLMMS
jgi:superfamily II RNA helicase